MDARNSFFLILVVAFKINGSLSAAELSFPNEGKKLNSPNGLYCVYRDNGKSANHELILENKKTKNITVIYEFNRSASAQWSPANDYLLINDFFASNESDCIVYTIATGKKVSLSKELYKASEFTDFFKNHHNYVTCDSIDRKIIKGKIKAYGDINPGGITKPFSYHLK